MLYDVDAFWRRPTTGPAVLAMAPMQSHQSTIIYQAGGQQQMPVATAMATAVPVNAGGGGSMLVAQGVVLQPPKPGEQAAGQLFAPGGTGGGVGGTPLMAVATPVATPVSPAGP